MKLEQQSAAELGKSIAAGKLSSREVTQYFLDRIDKLDGDLNSFVHVDPARALDDASGVDKRIAAGDKDLSPLAGVPIALKDILCTRGSGHYVWLADVGQLSTALQRRRSREAQSSWTGNDRQDEPRRVRHGRQYRDPASLVQPRIHGIRRARLAAAAVVRPWRWPQGWCLYRSAPIPVAQCASRQLFVAC